MPVITYDFLVSRNACKEREKFKELFGDAMNLTPDIAVQYANHLTSNWAILNCLTRDQLKEYGRRVHEAAKGFTGDKKAWNETRARIAAEIYCGKH